GIGLIIADVGDRRGAIDVAATSKGELAAVVMPVKWSLDALALAPVPAVAEPQGWRAIAAVGDEVLPLAIGGAAGGDAVRVEQAVVPGPLAIKGESVRREPDFGQARAALAPAQRLRRMARRGSELAIGRLERILGEGGQ